MIQFDLTHLRTFLVRLLFAIAMALIPAAIANGQALDCMYPAGNYQHPVAPHSVHSVHQPDDTAPDGANEQQSRRFDLSDDDKSLYSFDSDCSGSYCFVAILTGTRNASVAIDTASYASDTCSFTSSCRSAENEPPRS